jgi:hypothetical protein
MWRKVHDVVLPYGGAYGTVAHVRAWESGPADDPVVIAGQFGDHSGRPVTQAAPEVAAAVQAVLYPDGRRFAYVEHSPRSVFLHGGGPWGFEPVTFAYRRHLSQRQIRRRRRWNAAQVAGDVSLTVVTAVGATTYKYPPAKPDALPWEFGSPSWGRAFEVEWPDEAGALHYPYGPSLPPQLVHPAQLRIPQLLGDTLVDIWPEELYTPELIGGPEAAVAASRIRRKVRDQIDQEMTFADAYVTATATARDVVTLRGVSGADNPDALLITGHGATGVTLTRQSGPTRFVARLQSMLRRRRRRA